VSQRSMLGWLLGGFWLYCFLGWGGFGEIGGASTNSLGTALYLSFTQDT
jgi:hypothetical protein